jgi:hypothetical protein
VPDDPRSQPPQAGDPPDVSLRIYAPLADGHPAIGCPCALCDRALVAGDQTMLVPAELPKRPRAVESALCHANCVRLAIAAFLPELVIH